MAVTMTMSSNHFPPASGGSDTKSGDKRKDIWSSLLDSVATGKKLPEKNLIVLGGTVESQREFLDSLSPKAANRQNVRKPPVANQFALGYTYYEVLDADQEDNLARVSTYTLSSPSSSFDALLRPVLTPETIPETLIVVLLDWSQPWSWLRQLRRWILLLRSVLLSLSPDCTEALEEVMRSWRDRGRGGGATNLDGTPSATSVEGDTALPVGPGEWEDGIGLPLCVVCQNSQKMDVLEKTQGWKEEDFDVVLQYMRTVLLKHGASLIYTTPTAPSQLRSLIHASLGIHSLLKRQPLKHNVIDRDKILVPPNWDSWGKIRVLREGFDVEGVSAGWSNDLALSFPFPLSSAGDGELDTIGTEDVYGRNAQEGTAVALYEATVENSDLEALRLTRDDEASAAIESTTMDTQEFLAGQLKVLDGLKQKAEEEASREEARTKQQAHAQMNGRSGLGGDGLGGGRVNEHIGPVQTNIGGIQVDADDMVKRMVDRRARSPDTLEGPGEGDGGAEEEAGAPAAVDTENLKAFFSGLMNSKGRR